MNETSHAAPSPDMSRHAPSQPVPDLNKPFYNLDLYAVASLFDDAGIPRNRRSLMRYCQKDKLDCQKIETMMGGEEWRVDEQSARRLIEQFIELERQTPTSPDQPRHVPSHPNTAQAVNTAASSPDTPPSHPDWPRPVQPEPVHPSQSEFAENGTMAGETPSGTDAPTPDMSRHDQVQPTQENNASAALLEQLEKRIDEKDNQIEFLRREINTKNNQLADASEREKETNVLIQGLQSMVLKLTGNGTLVLSESVQKETTPFNSNFNSNQSLSYNHNNSHNRNNPNKKNRHH